MSGSGWTQVLVGLTLEVRCRLGSTPTAFKLEMQLGSGWVVTCEFWVQVMLELALLQLGPSSS